MRNKLQKALVKTTALTMTAALLLSSIPSSDVAAAKAKGPKLSQRSIRLVVNKTKKVKLKKTSRVRKTKWSIKNKKIAKLTKMKKTSVVIKGKKAGKTTVTAKVTLKEKKKTVKLKLKVQVVKAAKSTGEIGKKNTVTPMVSPVTSGKPGTSGDSPAVKNTPPGSPDDPSTPIPSASGNPDDPTPPVSDTLTILVPGERTGVKQGETLALTVSGTDQVSWSVTGGTGVTIDETGHLTVAKDAGAGTELTVTAQATGDPAKKAEKKLKVVENQTVTLADQQIQLNQTSEKNLSGLTFRSDKAYSTVTDPERGNVTRFDASQGYTSNSYDLLAWIVADPAWAGKTVTLSAYLKYEASEDITGNMNLVLNENWEHSNPAVKWNADPDTWYYVTGTYKLPEYRESRYDGNKNRLYIARDTQHLADGKNAVYYISDLVFSVEKSEINTVTLATEGDAGEIYQNHDLQCSATVSGTGVPSQKVIYSIDPPVEGTAISESGLLSVKNAAPGAKINIKATSVEDPTKSDTKEVTVKEQTIDELTVTAAGNVTRIYSGDSLQFSAKAVTSGDLETKVVWSIDQTVAGASISKDGLLTTKNLKEGTEIKVVAVATAVSDSTKSVRSTYTITILGDYVQPHEVKAIQSNQWNVFTEDYYCNLKYNEDEGSVYYENGTANLATGSRKACVGFLINSDGSTFDASVYNVLKVKFKADATENSTNSKGVTLRAYSGTDMGYTTSIPSVKESNYTKLPQERIWSIPISSLADAGVSLVDMKALSLEPSLSTKQALKVYSFTFERISPYEPYTISISQKNNETQVGEQRELPLKATVGNLNGEEVENVNINWESSDDTIATVSDNGIVTGVSAGEVTITATAAGYDDVKAAYKLTVYDHTPVSLGIRIGGVLNTSATYNVYMTLDELSSEKGGASIKAVLLDAGCEMVGEVDPDEITIDVLSTQQESFPTPPSVTEGKLTAVLPEGKESGSFYVKIKAGELTHNQNVCLVRGCRIPITKDTVYNASSGKQHSDIEISDGSATIHGSEGSSNGIGFKYTLSSGQKLSQYSKVFLMFGKSTSDADHDSGKYPVSLYVPVNGEDNGFITCGTDSTKLASQDSKTLGNITASYHTFTLTLSEEEKDTNLIHMAAGFGDRCNSDITLKCIILRN